MSDKPAIDLKWLCSWLEENSSGAYRPAKEAANVIRDLQQQLTEANARADAAEAIIKEAQEQESIGRVCKNINGGVAWNGSFLMCEDGDYLYARPPMPVKDELNSLVDSVISQLTNGFVRCENCGEQEDTADLDVMHELQEMRKILTQSEVKPS